MWSRLVNNALCDLSDEMEADRHRHLITCCYLLSIRFRMLGPVTMWTGETKILLRIIPTTLPTSEYFLFLDISVQLFFPFLITILTLINARFPFPRFSNYMHIWICKSATPDSVFSLFWCHGNSSSSPHAYASNLMFWCSPPLSEAMGHSVQGRLPRLQITPVARLESLSTRGLVVSSSDGVRPGEGRTFGG